MWPFTRKKEHVVSSPILLTNTLSGRKESFAPLKADTATLYSCGPTVYNRAHIGNLRSYVFADLIARVLGDAGYRVRRVVNITDVGHLVSDSDEGEDKMEKSARESGERAEDIAARYTKLFMEDIAALGLDTSDILFPRATDYINEQIALIQLLEEKGVTYRIRDGIYFDTSMFPGYGKLGGVPEDVVKNGDAATLADRIDLAGRSRIGENEEKRHAADFALWKFSAVGDKRQQEWDSPWGRGFPGWHIECSAMAKALLGETIDIHTGGMDHIPIHHNNEIAQSECAHGKPLARYFMHNAFLTMDTEKVSKSLGNVVYLSDLIEKGYHPLALRYLFLTAHYRSPLSFSWDALKAAHEALTRLWRQAHEIRTLSKGVSVPSETADRMTTLLRDDLGTPAALALLWETMKDDSVPPKAAWGVIEAADRVLGLSLTNVPESALPVPLESLSEDLRDLISEREAARKARDYAKADELRIHIERRGYRVEDTEEGPLLSKSHQ